jgi:hypothetical protein
MGKARGEKEGRVFNVNFAYRFQERRIKYYLNFCHRTCKNLINKRLSCESENVWAKEKKFLKREIDFKKFERVN